MWEEDIQIPITAVAWSQTTTDMRVTSSGGHICSVVQQPNQPAWNRSSSVSSTTAHRLTITTFRGQSETLNWAEKLNRKRNHGLASSATGDVVSFLFYTLQLEQPFVVLCWRRTRVEGGDERRSIYLLWMFSLIQRALATLHQPHHAARFAWSWYSCNLVLLPRTGQWKCVMNQARSDRD